MPVYSYECPHCEKETELAHRMIEAPTVICEDCHNKCHKLIGLSSVIVPQNMRAVKDPNYHGKTPIVPLNIIDQDRDGNITNVTTISKDGREPELIEN